MDSDSESEEPRYASMETGDAQVGKLSCVRTRRSTRERGKDHERLAPPGGHQVSVRNVRAGIRSIYT